MVGAEEKSLHFIVSRSLEMAFAAKFLDKPLEHLSNIFGYKDICNTVFKNIYFIVKKWRGVAPVRISE